MATTNTTYRSMSITDYELDVKKGILKVTGYDLEEMFLEPNKDMEKTKYSNSWNLKNPYDRRNATKIFMNEKIRGNETSLVKILDRCVEKNITIYIPMYIQS